MILWTENIARRQRLLPREGPVTAGVNGPRSSIQNKSARHGEVGGRGKVRERLHRAARQSEKTDGERGQEKSAWIAWDYFVKSC